MTESVTAQALPPYRERQLDNGAVAREVRVTRGHYRGHKLTFTQHSPDRYTVSGLHPLPQVGICIKRRSKHDHTVLMYDSGDMYTLRPEDEWLAHHTSQGSYYGVLAVGTTPQQAYEKTFNQHGV